MLGGSALAAMALRTEIEPTQPIPCGSSRALARLRKRWVRRLISRLCRSLRSLAGARQLPQLSFVAGEICVRHDGPANRNLSNTADPLWELCRWWNLRSTRWPCKPKPQQQSRSPVGALVISLPSPLSSCASFFLAMRPLVQRRQYQQGQQRRGNNPADHHRCQRPLHFGAGAGGECHGDKSK